MFELRIPLKHLVACKLGNVTIVAATSLPLILLTLAMALDYSNLTLQRRALQNDADLASLASVSRISDPENAVLQYFQMNGRKFAVRSGDSLLTANGTVKFDENAALKTNGGYAEVTKGRYTPDPAILPSLRFVAGATPFNAVSVTIHQKSELLFASSFTSAPVLSAVGTATSYKAAAFSIGSRLASLDSGVLNKLLGGLLGTNVSLTVMDYQTLLNADVDALQFADALAVNLGLTAGTYDQLLNTDISFKQLLNGLLKTKGIAPNAAVVLSQLQQSLNKAQINLKLGEILNLGSASQKIVGTGDSLTVNASLFDLVTAAATAANGGKQVAIDLGTGIPGLVSTTLKIAIGEPSVATPMLALGQPGSTVRSSQTRVKIVASVNGLSAIAGLQVQVPIYVFIANAEAKLSKITCFGGTKTNASVDISAVPGLAELALGNVDDAAFTNFGTTPRVTKAAIVNSSLLKILAMADVNAANVSQKTITFSPSDIATGTVKSVSTQDTLTSLVSSLLGNLSLDVNVLFVTLGTPSTVTKDLGQTLAVATAPIDSVLYNTLLVLGVKVGEADIRVTGVTCQRPVLIN